MWAHLAKRASPRKLKLPSESPFHFPSCNPSQHSKFLEKTVLPDAQTRVNPRCPFLGFGQVGIFTSINELGRHNFLFPEDPFGSCSSLMLARGRASVAEAAESTDAEEDYSGSNEVEDLLEQMMREEGEKGKPLLEHQKSEMPGVATYKYKLLRRRQIKMETKAWEEAAKEYQELLEDMCQQKLAPNLPYMKSLFLGWFEPLRDAVVAEQEACKEIKHRMTHALYFNDLPAEMMAVITMHKLMGLLMSNSNGLGTARVIQAALQIGEAIENEVYYILKLEHYFQLYIFIC